MPLDALSASRFAANADMSRAVRRSHGLRVLGLGLGAIMVGMVLYAQDAPLSVWAMLILYVLAWPHVAWFALRHSDNPVALDRRFFLGDAAMGGVWIALMRFNLLPSVVLATMLAMTLIAVGGHRMLLRGLAALALACCVAAVANGVAFEPETRVLEIVASLPMLMVFPTTLGVVTHGLARHMRAQNLELFRMGSVDSLSGLLNRTHWEDAVNAALHRNLLGPAVMLLIDIDHFKDVNDVHGHTAGDDVIRQVGAIIRDSLREGDLAGRYGGDEFCVVLRGAELAAAAKVAERIRSDVERVLCERVPGLRCTLSIGLACNSGSTRTASEWVNQADAALYGAKLEGRNRLMMVA
jgi:diguanylate cyclase